MGGPGAGRGRSRPLQSFGGGQCRLGGRRGWDGKAILADFTTSPPWAQPSGEPPHSTFASGCRASIGKRIKSLFSSFTANSRFPGSPSPFSPLPPFFLIRPYFFYCYEMWLCLYGYQLFPRVWVSPQDPAAASALGAATAAERR